MSLAMRNLVFSIVVPGLGAVVAPWWILTRGRSRPAASAWPAIACIGAGVALYVVCARLFALAGRGTPGPWDPPRRFVVVGPYRWVRNPIYVAALLVVVGEAWLFTSLRLVLYTCAMALFFHAFVVWYEEPTLRRRFGQEYSRYLGAVPRWIPRRPRHP